eukprot:jgi/Mesvir1/28942/Mv17724-RA.1
MAIQDEAVTHRKYTLGKKLKQKFLARAGHEETHNAGPASPKHARIVSTALNNTFLVDECDASQMSPKFKDMEGTRRVPFMHLPALAGNRKSEKLDGGAPYMKLKELPQIAPRTTDGHLGGWHVGIDVLRMGACVERPRSAKHFSPEKESSGSLTERCPSAADAVHEDNRFRRGVCRPASSAEMSSHAEGHKPRSAWRCLVCTNMNPASSRRCRSCHFSIYFSMDDAEADAIARSPREDSVPRRAFMPDESWSPRHTARPGLQAVLPEIGTMSTQRVPAHAGVESLAQRLNSIHVKTDDLDDDWAAP